MLHHSSRLPQEGKEHSSPPQGVAQSRVLWARILYICHVLCLQDVLLVLIFQCAAVSGQCEMRDEQ